MPLSQVNYITEITVAETCKSNNYNNFNPELPNAVSSK